MMFYNKNSHLLHSQGLQNFHFSLSLQTMKYSIRPIIIILVAMSAFAGTDFVYASSGTQLQNKNNLLISGSIENMQDNEKIKEDIQGYIIESYKIQGTKILKDLDIKLQKSIPNIDDREEAYIKIKTSLEIRKKRIEDIDASTIKKQILAEFLDHMIHLINLKLEEFNKN